MSKSTVLNKKKKNRELSEFWRYLIIGFSTTALNWMISILLKETAGIEETALGNTMITIIAWVLSTVFFAFWTYKFFVFRSKSLKPIVLWTEFAGFTGARLLTLGVEAVIMFVFCDLLGLDHIIRFDFDRVVGKLVHTGFTINIREYYLVKLGACVVTTILNYIFSKLIVFKKGQQLSYAEAEKDEGEGN